MASTGERCGRGTLKSPDGSSYEGEWVANMYEGQGKLTRADGSTHEGEFVKHKPNGKGKATAANGDEWQGVFVNGAMFGEHGEYKGVDGSTYVGEWKVGHRDGRGNGFDASSGVRSRHIGINFNYRVVDHTRRVLGTRLPLCPMERKKRIAL